VSRSIGKVWLGEQISRRATVLGAAGIIIILVLTGVKVVAVLDQLNRIDRISTQQILIERQMSDLHAYGMIAQRLSAASHGADRGALVQELDSATAALAARHQLLDNSGIAEAPQAVAASLEYNFAKLLALAALIRDPILGQPSMDIAEQTRVLIDSNLRGTMDNWTNALLRDAKSARDQIKIALGLSSIIMLTAILLSWLFVLRPLSRTVVDGTHHARALEDALKHTAGHDRLTGLPNRTRAAELIDHQISRRRKVSVGVIHLNLCQFRTINEEMGHEAGDQVLIETAHRLSAIIGEREFVARIGGDEFLILADSVTCAEDLAVKAADLRRTVREVYDLPGGQRLIDCVIGAVWSANGTTDAESLSVRADIALHAAVNGDGGPVRLFTHAMLEEFTLRDALGRELRQSLEKGELVAFFQPQIRADNGEVSGFETLIRWRHPTRGLLAPGLFLQLAEEMGLADQIGATVLDQALDAWQGWAAAGFTVPHVAVNYSAAQLADTMLADRIKWALERRNLLPECLALEVVETVAVENDNALAVRTIRSLAAAGFSIELDDFGTGHASIANIHRFCACRIKIDRSFVTNIDQREDLSAMADAMVRMASALGVDTIAEGVETAEERAKVIALGCHSLQGYNIARPMAFEDSVLWLTEHRVLNHSRMRARRVV